MGGSPRYRNTAVSEGVANSKPGSPAFDNYLRKIGNCQIILNIFSNLLKNHVAPLRNANNRDFHMHSCAFKGPADNSDIPVH